MNRLALFALAAACAALSVPAAAQFAKPEDAVKYRQSAMFMQSQHFGRIAAMANGRVPYDQASAVANAEIVAMVSQLPWSGAYAPGTEGGKAKAEIWKEPAIGCDRVEIAQVQPLRREVRHERARTVVSEHPPDLLFEHRRLVEFSRRRDRDQFVVWNAAPEEE